VRIRDDYLKGGGTLIQVYTGNGKGKTTAALGLALRATGAGLKVYIGQFAKGKNYSELKALKKMGNIKVEQFGTTCFIKKAPAAGDIRLAKKGLKRIKEIIAQKKYDLIILDEINIAIHLKLLALEEVLDAIKKAPKKTELVFTGRYAHPKILKCADLVSEIKEVKHYYNRGIKARRGIEF
jgi:cob(I)alamin adenosyltransferase